MRILITGIRGSVGTAVAEALLERREGLAIRGITYRERQRCSQRLATKVAQ